MFMKWEHRRTLIRNEIIRYNPSILCFQEVDRFEDLNRILHKDGFRGVYQARTGDARDGCAIFWKHKLFSLVNEDNIEFKEFGLRDNVAQFCVLKMNESQNHIDDIENLKAQPSRNILIGNIHVLFNPSRGDIKLGQVRLFLDMAHRLSQTWGNIPTILGGDLNSMPQLNIEHHGRKNISGQICPLDYPRFHSESSYSSRPLLHKWSKGELRLATGTEESTYLRHNLKLNSAYRGVQVIAMIEMREHLVREKWIDIETSKIIRDKLRWCYRIEGVNHLQKCRHLVQQYMDSTRGIGWGKDGRHPDQHGPKPVESLE
nr:carbon catabolite repressor protein 4 homolog 5 isoform X2 [Tanacetum cinerariifolium]